MGGISLVFETARLRVFGSIVKPWESRAGFQLYVAFLKEMGTSQTVAHALVTDERENKNDSSAAKARLEYLEVSDAFRRQKYGTEVIQGIETHLGCELTTSPASPQGTALWKKLGRLDALPDDFDLQVSAIRTMANNLEQATQSSLDPLFEIVADANRPAQDRRQALVDLRKTLQQILFTIQP